MQETATDVLCVQEWCLAGHHASGVVRDEGRAMIVTSIIGRTPTAIVLGRNAADSLLHVQHLQCGATVAHLRWKSEPLLLISAHFPVTDIVA